MKTPSKPRQPPFNVETFLATDGVRRKIVSYRKNQIIFSQGDPAHSVMYLRRGTVKIAVTSRAGKEAVIALLTSGDFFGEGSIAGQTKRPATAKAMEPTFLLEIEKPEMMRLISQEHAFSDRFLIHMLKRNIRIEEDLVDQLFNSIEKRLARTLLLIASYGKNDTSQKIVADVTQEMLAEMIGTSRSRVNVFMNKFRRLGFIRYNGGLHVNDSLLHVILHD